MYTHHSRARFFSLSKPPLPSRRLPPIASLPQFPIIQIAFVRYGMIAVSPSLQRGPTHTSQQPRQRSSLHSKSRGAALARHPSASSSTAYASPQTRCAARTALAATATTMDSSQINRRQRSRLSSKEIHPHSSPKSRRQSTTRAAPVASRVVSSGTVNAIMLASCAPTCASVSVAKILPRENLPTASSSPSPRCAPFPQSTSTGWRAVCRPARTPWEAPSSSETRRLCPEKPRSLPEDHGQSGVPAECGHCLIRV
jgi:hypothetical protein